MIHRYWLRDKEKKLSELTALDTVLCGVVTEKSFLLNQNYNQYVFRVALWANKIQIKEALKRVFGVDAVSVNTLRVKGKRRRFKGREGVTSAYKKAVVRLPEGKTLDHNLSMGEKS